MFLIERAINLELCFGHSPGEEEKSNFLALNTQTKKLKKSQRLLKATEFF
jgi:hypothetical protein